MADERRALHAYLSEKAHDHWQKVSEDNGVSVTGFLEALGHELGDEIDAAGGDAEEMSPEWKARVKAARKIDAQRRRRGAA